MTDYVISKEYLHQIELRLGVVCAEVRSHLLETELQKERKRIIKLIEPFEWSGSHTDYEDSWGVMTRACPFCFNAKKDGHKPACLLVSLRGEP